MTAQPHQPEPWRPPRRRHPRRRPDPARITGDPKPSGAPRLQMKYDTADGLDADDVAAIIGRWRAHDWTD
ncbi:hypothetical protein EKO23_15235 [Nocardioides guangzhouensis]|uniref:Uncharacterized protein n=1 Tax=Nocardioides guangzhouensis TaxID=2497878 RepID=A0A4Q4ZAR3_9ACTN|nr:hypothetical protein [Nocardioides guangzhouensis]RYP84615.1 hypothetical protein EKO23_15235 [Nocardioides guangzhouensis]